MKSKKILLTLMIVFAITTIGLSVWLGIAYHNNQATQAQLENHYQQSYFVLLDETNDMEIKMAKLLMTSSPKTQQDMLYDIWKSAEVSANALSALSSRNTTITNTLRFVNQVGDFSLFLANQIAGGATITDEQYESFDKIHDMLVNLGVELNKIKDEISKGYSFMDNMNTDKDLLTNVLGLLNEPSVKYPQLIYDGPFSDALKDKDTKGLTGNDITEAQGRSIIEKIYSNKTVSGLQFVGEWDSDIKTLNYQATINNKEITIQLARKGGMPLSVNMPRNVTTPKYTEEECSKFASDYLLACGFENMSEVWICNDNSTIYINFAPKINGVIYYPDLIKVKVASDNGDILGLEARNYAFNHTSRSLPSLELTMEQAKSKVSVKAEITNGRLALIPYKTNQELLTYEFYATYKGDYYVYIDAITGEEVNILYVISTTNGDLLM